MAKEEWRHRTLRFMAKAVVDKSIEKIVGDPLSSTGFVTFTSLSTSVLASQARLYPSPLQMLVSRAPSRSDIIWVNLERTISRRFFKTVLSVVFATFLTFLVATACAAISWAMTPGNIKKWDPFEKLLENFPYGEKGLAFIAPILIMIMVSSDTLWKCTASEFCMAAARRIEFCADDDDGI